MSRPMITDVFKFHDIVDKWKPPKEVWPFKYGNFIPVMLAFGQTHAFCYHLRRCLKISPNYRGSIYPATIALAAAGVYVFQTYAVTSKIVDGLSCRLCIPAFSVSGQVVLGCLVPSLIGLSSCFYVAEKALTYPVPPIFGATREVYELLAKFFKPKIPLFATLAVFQVVAAVYVTQMKMSTFQTMRNVSFKDKSYHYLD